MKIATFNINNVNRRLPNLLRWLRAAKPDVVCLQELKATDDGVPDRGDREGRLRRGVARPEDLERRRHPGAQRRAGADAAPRCPATATDDEARYIEAAVDGIIVASHLSAERQSAARAEIRLQARLVRAAAVATPANCSSRTSRWCWPATTTSRRPSCDIYPTRVMGQGRADPAEEPRRVQGAGRRRAGPTRSARCIRTSRCSRSGTTSATAGRATPACGSIICC